MLRGHWVTLALSLSISASAAFAWSGCGGGSSHDVVCGPGTVLTGSTCVVAASEAGAAADAASHGDAEGGSAQVAPTFAGVSALAPASSTSIFVAWKPATEGDLPPSSMRYRVFLGVGSESAIDYTKPLATTVAGATSFYATALDSTKTYWVAVRAVDPSGNSDSNLVAKSATPGGDTTAPTFAGVKAAASAGAGAVSLTWPAASDKETPADAIVYFVYVSNQLTTFDFATPALITDPGATSATVPYLYDPTLIYGFVVRARDAAGNFDGNDATATSRAGVDTDPPRFAGCASAIADSAGSAVLTWSLANDDGTPQNLVQYDVFAANTASGGFTFSKPTLSRTSVASAEVTGLAQSTAWHFIVRARDFAGNEDQNLVDCVTTTSADPNPPDFAGLTGVAVQSDARTATFSWSAATDPETASSEIVYDLFQGLAHGAEDFTRPIATSEPGATSMLATDLTPDATLYWVVRARDKAGNRDSNTIELSGMTDVSLSEQVQSTLSSDCGVAGCHVPGNPPLGLVLTPGFSYSFLVNVKSREYPVELRVNPGDPTASFFYRKVSENPPPVGYQMPAPATGSVLPPAEIERIRRWILQGAPNN